MSNDETRFGDLFPLPLTSIEAFHWLDHSPAFPNFIFARLEFDVAIDPRLAKSAWFAVIQRHPLGLVFPESDSNRQLNWRPATDPAELERCFTFDDQQQPGPADVDFPDLRHRTAPSLKLQTWGLSGQRRNRLTFCIHHAICDGLGGVYAVNEWLILYNNLAAGRAPESGLRNIDADRIHRRNELGLRKWSYLKHLPKQPVALFGASKFIFRKTATLNHSAEQSTPAKVNESGRSQLIGTWMSRNETRQMYRQANRWKVNSNFLLLGNLFRTLGNYRRRNHSDQQRRATDRDWMRVILPISIRNHADRRFPVSNRTSLVQIDRRWPGENPHQNFLKMLQREVDIINRWQLDRTFLIAINALSVSNRLLRRVADNPKPRGLAVFTDLGQPWRYASKVIARSSNSDSDPVLPVEYDLAGPIRSGTPLNFSFARSDDRLRISLHYDQQFVSGEDAQWMLNDFRTGLLSIGLEEDSTSID